MTSLTLLCPLRDFPCMLPTCFPIALVLLVAGLVPAAALLYRLTYYLRFERLPFPDAVRLSGRVAGVVPGRLVGRHFGRTPPFLLQSASGPPLPVEPEGAFLGGWRRRLRDGQKVTVLGVMSTVPRASEALFRQPAAQPGLQALQIGPDRRRAVRRAAWLALICWLVFGGCLYWRTAAARRRQEAQLSAGDAAPTAGVVPADAASWEEAALVSSLGGEVILWVTTGHPSVLGPLKDEVVRPVVRRHFKQLTACYQEQLRANPYLEDDLLIRFTISKSGWVMSSRVSSSTFADEPLEDCVAQAMLRWQFPRPRGDSVSVHYPLRLKAGRRDTPPPPDPDAYRL